LRKIARNRRTAQALGGRRGEKLRETVRKGNLRTKT